jgi:hypothetical protein
MRQDVDNSRTDASDGIVYSQVELHERITCLLLCESNGFIRVLLTIVWCKTSGGDERLVRSRRGF